MENEETNREDSEPCLVVTLRSGKELGAHKNKELRVKKAVEDDDEEQEDEGQSPSCDVWRKKIQSKRVHLVNYWTGIQHPGSNARRYSREA